MTTPATPSERPAPPGGWPTGGTQVAGFHLCTPCGDSIYPGEHVYDNGDGNVRCAVCEIKHRTTADEDIRRAMDDLDEQLARTAAALEHFHQVLAESRAALAKLRNGEVQS